MLYLSGYLVEIPSLRTLRVFAFAVAALLTIPTTVLAGPVEEANAMVSNGEALLQKAKKTRKKKKRPKMLADGLKQYAKAYMLITSRKLQNDAPDLLKKISDQISKANKMPEVIKMRRELLGKAVDATVAGEYTKAYDLMASLRELDPREWSVEYALAVLGQRMEGG